METVVLAYSGGLDTSCILKWLLERGHRVVCYVADVGQQEDLQAVRAKALAIGATDVVVDDRRNDFTANYVWPSLRMGLVYERRYLLGTALARPCISAGLVECAKQQGARLLAHGATAKGNDQVRFELSCRAIEPSLSVLAPWRDEEFCRCFQGREDLIEYAKRHGIPVEATLAAPWSMDANVMHVSYESGVLEDPARAPPSTMFKWTKAVDSTPDLPCNITLSFENGVAVCVHLDNTSTIEGTPLELLTALNALGGSHGLGRIDIVENRFLGLKSRGVYETPGAYIVHVAHEDLEIFCLDREVLRVKQLLADRMADYVYNGFWFSPEARYVRRCLEMSQETVTGTVNLRLYKGAITVLGRTASAALYNERLVSMNAHGDFSPADATGFINIHALRLREDRRVHSLQHN